MNTPTAPELTVEEIARLRELAEKATPGPRLVVHHEEACVYQGEWRDGWVVTGDTYVPDYECAMLCEADAQFRGATDPQTILRLISTVERLTLRAMPVETALRALEIAADDFLERLPEFHANVVAKINGRELSNDAPLAELELDTDALFAALNGATAILRPTHQPTQTRESGDV